MISLEEAADKVLVTLDALAPEIVDLGDALGCVLAEEVVATEAIPPFDNTSVDGYALRSTDVGEVPCVLEMIGELPAGAGVAPPIGAGQALRIMTGAPVPEGADAIAMVEDSETSLGNVIIKAPVRAGENVRLAGSDVQPGDLVLSSGTVLRPAHLGVLAEMAHLRVLVQRRLRVGVISTGDELIADASPLAPGQIRESNSALLRGLLEEANCEPVDFGIVPDEEAALERALLDGAASCDALVTSGGVSMGDYDLVKVMLDKLGTMEWMQVSIRPAKPFAFGLLGERRTPVFGLPGNPVSSLVSFELLARPALLKMMGHRAINRPTLKAIADVPIRRNTSDERVNFVRVTTAIGDDGRIHVAPTGAQGSHQLANSAAASGFCRLDDGAGVAAGSEVTVLLLGVAPGLL